MKNSPQGKSCAQTVANPANGRARCAHSSDGEGPVAAARVWAEEISRMCAPSFAYAAEKF